MNMRRPLALAVLGALVLVACSDDDDDAQVSTGSTETTVAGSDTAATKPEVTSPQATSSASSAPDGSSSQITLPDISLPNISLPNISLPDISLPDISLPDISIPDTEELLRRVFPGLDDQQVSCLADGLGDVRDVKPDQILGLIGDCNITMSDLTGGG
jgi:hypothetical protein